MKVMRTSSKAQLRVGSVLAGLLLIVLLWVPDLERVTGDCGDSTFFSLSTFSSATISLVSHSWLDRGGSIRMAPPYDLNTTQTSNASAMIGGGSTFGVGQVLYKTPISLVHPDTNNSASFSTFFSFSLISATQVSPGVHGMAFLIIPDQNLVTETSAGGPELLNPYSDIWANLTSHVFAVQFTKWNQSSTQPGLNSTVNGTLDDRPKVLDLFSSYLEDAQMNFAWIDYDATTLLLQVRISNTSDGPRWVLLSTTYDLSGVLLNTMYIGFSSRDKLSVQSWNFSAAGCSPPIPASTVQPMPPPGPSNNPVPPQIPGHPDDHEPGNPTEGNHGPALDPKHSWINHRLLIYIGASCGGALLICLLLAFGCGYVLRVMLKYRGASSVPDRDIPIAPQIFTYRTLSLATNGFDERALLGRGGFGSVYKGIIAEDESSSIVAVKRIESKNDAQRERQFIAEVASIGRLRHRNLVQLLGWCHEKGELLLVYDYMPNGSLDRLLFGTQERVLPWESRYNIVSGVAAALAYLHGEWEKQVVHRDVKASNVLLDSDFNPRLGDFGLARLIEHNKNPKGTSIAGTLGYLAPEITITGKATDKTDVFSFGALALEVACGRQPIQRSLPPEEVVLVDWVWHLHSMGEMVTAIDPRLQPDDFPTDEATTLLSLGLLCSHPDPAARPSMRQVVRMLNDELVCPVVPDFKPIPPFSAFRPPPDYYNTPTARALGATATSNNKAANKTSGRTQARVSDCSSV